MQKKISSLQTFQVAGAWASGFLSLGMIVFLYIAGAVFRVGGKYHILLTDLIAVLCLLLAVKQLRKGPIAFLRVLQEWIPVLLSPLAERLVKLWTGVMVGSAVIVVAAVHCFTYPYYYETWLALKLILAAALPLCGFTVALILRRAWVPLSALDLALFPAFFLVGGLPGVFLIPGLVGWIAFGLERAGAQFSPFGLSLLLPYALGMLFLAVLPFFALSGAIGSALVILRLNHTVLSGKPTPAARVDLSELYLPQKPRIGLPRPLRARLYFILRRAWEWFKRFMGSEESQARPGM